VQADASTVEVWGSLIVWVSIAVTTVVRAVVISRAFFWQDDYIHVWTAWNAPAEELILQEWNGHRQPFSFAITWVLARLWPQEWLPAAAMLVLVSALLPTMFWLAVRTLVGLRWSAVIATVGFSVWPGLLIPQTWLTSGLELFALVAILAALWVFASRHRSRTVLITVLLVVGFGFTERALFLLPVLLAGGYLVAGGSVRSRVTGVYRGDRLLWWVLSLTTLLLLVVTRLLSSGSAGGRPATAGEILRGLWYAGPSGMMRDLLGLNAFWPDERTTIPGPIPVWVFALSAVLWMVLLVVGFRWSRSQLGHCLLVTGSFLVVETVIVGLFRGGFIGPQVHQDPRYYELSGTLVLLCLASFGRYPPLRRPPTWWLAPIAVVSVVGFLASALAIARTVNGEVPRAWLAMARAQFTGPGSPDLVSTPSPPNMIVPIFVGIDESGAEFEYATTRTLLEVGPEQPRMMTSTIFPVGADLTGRVAPVALSPVKSATVPGFGADCSVKLTERWVRVPMTEGGLGNPLLSIDYLAGADAVLEVRSGNWVQSTTVPAGLKAVWLVPPLGPFTGFEIRVLEGTETVCLGAARAGGGTTETRAVTP
jgi:hypothetical protein